MRRIAVFFSVLLIISSPVMAAKTAPILEHIPNAEMVGNGELHYMLWHVYNAELYAPNGSFSTDTPFALSLTYFVDIDGEELAKRTAEEMRKSGFSDEVKLAAWYASMKELFPNVTKGSVITGIYHPGKPTQFYDAKGSLGTIKDAEFGKHFFNIWLSDSTSVPKLRKALLGR